MKTDSSSYEVGYVVACKDYLIDIEGLPSVKVNDIIEGPEGAIAIVNTLAESKVKALLLNGKAIKPGDSFMSKGKNLSFPPGENLLGRIINPLSEPLDGKTLASSSSKNTVEIEQIATGIETRMRINKQILTGMTIVDVLVPIGKGQRELLFGEPRSGKTSFLLNLIVNQKGKNMVCIYVAIGKAEIEIKRLSHYLEENDASPYSILIAAFPSDGAPLISLAPQSGFAIAEYFQQQSRDVLLILDDFGTHAKFLREIALLSERVPGRESYPGDIFYQQAHLMERAGNFNEKKGKGSITLFPIIETSIENFTNLIPTNVMASTDGHLFFSSSLFSQGQYPPVDIDKSVTRVGRQTQHILVQHLSDRVRTLLASYHEMINYSRFGSDLSTQTQLLLKQGATALELLKQEHVERIELPVQVMLLALLFTSFVADNEKEFIIANKQKILSALQIRPEFQEIGKNIFTFDFTKLIAKMNEKLNVLKEVCQ